jgi:hypothetical protein
VTLRVEGDAVVEGTVVGDCRSLDLVAGGQVTVSGDIDNSCSDSQSTADLRLVSGSDLTLSGSRVVSSGDVVITNDTTLTDADFDLAPGAAPGVRAHATSRQVNFCLANGAEFVPDPAVRPEGRNGRTWVLSCNGDGTISGGTEVRGQGGGGGEDGDVQGGENDDDVTGEGDDGGDAGRLDVRVTGNLDFPENAAVIFDLGDGGDGGSSTVTAQAPGGSATATGGDGGESGTLRVSANGGISIGPGGLIIRPGTPGAGGSATAIAADGRDAGEEAAQPGGDATARGGTGGASPRARLRSRGSVAGLANLQIDDAPGGLGGDAEATAGRGGDGNQAFPDGADGGSMAATGGDGGEALATGVDDAPIGVGGMGGAASIFNGVGGMGWDGCSVDPTEPGGTGGRGGNGAAASGEGGTGNLLDGDAGDVVSGAGAGSGGGGGDGKGPGGGGPGGTETLEANGGDVDDRNPNFANGDGGEACEGEEQPVEVEFALGLEGFLSQPGGIPDGNYTVPIEGVDPNTQETYSGELAISTSGQTFWSDTPGGGGPRFGFGPDGSITFWVGSAGIGGVESQVPLAFGACDSTGAANTSLPFEITLVSGSGAPLAAPDGGPLRIDTDGDGCFDEALPENAEGVRVRWRGNGFVDIVALTILIAIIAATAG